MLLLRSGARAPASRGDILAPASERPNPTFIFGWGNAEKNYLFYNLRFFSDSRIFAETLV
jgi:hypothetical protein